MTLGTTMMQPNDSSGSGQLVSSAAEFRAWLARAAPGERLEYHRGLLALDRIKGASSLKEAERRKLAVVAEQASEFAARGKLHLLQERHGGGDYSYWAVARAPARLAEQITSRLSIIQSSERPRAHELGRPRVDAGDP